MGAAGTGAASACVCYMPVCARADGAPSPADRPGHSPQNDQRPAWHHWALSIIQLPSIRRIR